MVVRLEIASPKQPPTPSSLTKQTLLLEADSLHTSTRIAEVVVRKRPRCVFLWGCLRY